MPSDELSTESSTQPTDPQNVEQNAQLPLVQPTGTGLPDSSQAAAGETVPSPAAPAAVPPSVSQSDFAILQNELKQQTASLNQLQGAYAALQQQRAAPAAQPEVTDAQLQEWLESGEGEKILRANRVMQAQSAQANTAQVEQLRQQSIAIAGPLARKVAAGDMPHYNEFKGDIDAVLNALPADALTNPEAYTFAHNQIVAKPENIKRIVDREVEAELRRRTQQAAVEPPAGPAGRVVTTQLPDGVPTPEQVFPDMKPDFDLQHWMKVMGYADWPDFVKRTTPPEGGYQ